MWLSFVAWRRVTAVPDRFVNARAAHQLRQMILVRTDRRETLFRQGPVLIY